MLNFEYEKAVRIDAENNMKKKLTVEINNSNSQLSFQKRLNEIKTIANSEKNDINDFKLRLRQTAKNTLDSIKNKNDS